MTWKSSDVSRNWYDSLIAIGGALLRGMPIMVIGFVIGAVTMAAILGPLGPEWISFDYWQEGGNNVSRSEVLRNVGLLIVGTVGLGFGIWRAYTAYRQTVVSEQGHITDRFSTAVEHLGSKELPVRLGGVYALWRLSEDSATRDEKTIWDILCAFIRNPPHEHRENEKVSERTESSNPDGEVMVATEHDLVRPDIQTILDLLTTNAAAKQMVGAGYSLKLNDSNLCKANLFNANLNGANLSEANLGEANLGDADLSGANLSGAKLFGANLSQANLSDADLSGAKFSDADLSGANLSGAKLRGANLNKANLSSANLSGAYFIWANLSEAELFMANLNGADLSCANLKTAKNLTQEQLNAACISKGGKEPILPG